MIKDIKRNWVNLFVVCGFGFTAVYVVSQLQCFEGMVLGLLCMIIVSQWAISMKTEDE